VCITFGIFFSAVQIYASQANTEEPDAILVLGAGIMGTQLSFTLRYRLDRAAAIYNENPGSIIIVSGGLGDTAIITEAYGMKRYLEQMGIPSESILMEEEATSTFENFKFSQAILDEHFNGEDYTTVFVSDRFHLLRAKLIAMRLGMDADGSHGRSLRATLPMYYLREYFAFSWFLVNYPFLS